MLGRAAALIVRSYQLTFGRWLGGRCRFHPSCSQYAIEAFRAHGLMRGAVLAAWRLVRCGPWTAGGIDPVPGPPSGPVGVSRG